MVDEEEQDVVISTCCHSINLLVQKHFPASIRYLADVLSPMQAHCKDIKKRYPNAKTVFIGPCVAKKDEASHYAGIVDAVLTFDELTEWLKAEDIVIPRDMDSEEYSRTRLFPTTGGILKTMKKDKNNCPNFCNFCRLMAPTTKKLKSRNDVRATGYIPTSQFSSLFSPFYSLTLLRRGCVEKLAHGIVRWCAFLSASSWGA